MKPILTAEQVEDLRLFVVSFVLRRANGRLLGLLETTKGQRKFLAELDHFRWLDPRFATLVPRNCQTIRDIEQILSAKGAPRTCHVISTDSGISGRNLLLADALSTVVARGAGSIVFCVPGKLAYYEAEEPLERYVCQHV